MTATAQAPAAEQTSPCIECAGELPASRGFVLVGPQPGMVFNLCSLHCLQRFVGAARPTANQHTPPEYLQPCGTEAAYRRHRRHGEVPDTDCLAAHASHERDRVARAAGRNGKR